MLTTNAAATADQIAAAIKSAVPVPTSCYGGCARIYIQFLKANRNAAKKATEKLPGMRYQVVAGYGLRDALYIGYDMGNKAVVAQAVGIVAALQEIGVWACWEGGED